MNIFDRVSASLRGDDARGDVTRGGDARDLENDGRKARDEGAGDDARRDEGAGDDARRDDAGDALRDNGETLGARTLRVAFSSNA